MDTRNTRFVAIALLVFGEWGGRWREGLGYGAPEYSFINETRSRRCFTQVFYEVVVSCRSSWPIHLKAIKSIISLTTPIK